MGFLSTAIKAVKSKVMPSRTAPAVAHSRPDGHPNRPLVRKARKALAKAFRRTSSSKIYASQRPSEDQPRPSAAPFLQRTSVEPGLGTVPWPSPSPMKLSVPVAAGKSDAAVRLPPRDALRSPRGSAGPLAAKNKTVLGELMRREEGVGLVFLSMMVVGVDATAQLTASALRATVAAKSTSRQQDGSSTSVVDREEAAPSSASSSSSSPSSSTTTKSKSLLAQAIGAMLLFVQEQGPLTRQALDELPQLIRNALEARAQEDAALRQRLLSNLQEWTLDVEQALNDGTAAHRREVEATREFLETGVMPTLERTWPLASDFQVSAAAEPVVAPTPEPESPKGLGARLKEAAAKLASPLLGGDATTTSTPATPAKAAAGSTVAPAAPKAGEEGNRVVSGIMESVMQRRRDRVKDAVAAAIASRRRINTAADGGSVPPGEAKKALAQALGDAERAAAKLDPLLGTASPSQPAVVGAAPFSVKDTPLGAITTKRADGQVAPRRVAPSPPPAPPSPPQAPKPPTPVLANAAPATAVPPAPNALAAVGKGALTLGAFVLPWLIITKAANNGGGEGGNGGSGGRGGGSGRGKGGKGNGKGDGKPRGGSLLMRMLVLASCAVVGYVARDRLGGVQRVAAQVVALTAAMWAALVEEEEDVEDRVQMALAYVQ